MQPPQPLIKQALLFGSSTNFTQGAGGNLSCKVENTIWIKASGTRLKDANTKQIFIPLNLELVKKAVLNSEELTSCYQSGFNVGKLRPSIETSIHCLLPHNYVAHLHSLGAIATSIMKNAEDLFFKMLPEVNKIFIPYCKPGIQLAKKIAENTNLSEIDPEQELLILLGNHGIIAAAKDSNVASNLIFEFESIFEIPNLIENFEKDFNSDFIEIFPESTLGYEEIEFLLGGALTPDQVVFLGAVPFTPANEFAYDSISFICENGSVWHKSTLSDDAIEILISFVKIAKMLPYQSNVNYLNDENIGELLNWEAEKWRKSQQR